MGRANTDVFCELINVKQRHSRPENYMPPPAWPYQQKMSREKMPSVAASPNPNPSIEISPQSQFWRESLAGVPTMQPWIMSDPSYRYLQNSGLAYNDMVPQNAAGKSGNTYGSHPYWLTSRLNGLPRDVSVNGSDLETNNSLSPKSYLDENLESESFSPGSMPDPTSSSGDWDGYSTSFASVKESPSTSAPPGLHLRPMPAQTDEDVGDFNYAGLPRIGLGIAIPPMEPAGSSYYQNGELSGSMGDTQQTNFENSYSHGNSPCASPWYFPGYSLDRSGLPYTTQDEQSNNVRDEAVCGASASQSTSYRRQHTAPWSASRVGAPAQAKLQDRFQVPQNTDAQTQRKHNDDVLINGKKEGLTYKEIRKKMSGEKPAESTLRGRYRSLTKARQDRVRKPIWQTRDVS